MKKLQLAFISGQNVNHDKKVVAKKLDELFEELKKFNEEIIVMNGGHVGGFMSMISEKAKKNGFLTLGVLPIDFEKEFQKRKKFKDVYDNFSDIIINTTAGFGLRNEVLVRSADLVVLVNGGLGASGSFAELTFAYHARKKIFVLEGTGGLADKLKEIIKGHGTQGFLDIRKKVKVNFFETPKQLADEIKKELKKFK
ncbi:MAG TPA: hypothetical protein VJK05_00990 [archaeon]|nr:hypothetical protein [archaeon]